MKAGDKVWVYNYAKQKIECVEIASMTVDGDYGTYMRGGSYGYAVCFTPGFDAFPTREELCEHYRKIFSDMTQRDRKLPAWKRAEKDISIPGRFLHLTIHNGHKIVTIVDKIYEGSLFINIDDLAEIPIED